MKSCANIDDDPVWGQGHNGSVKAVPGSARIHERNKLAKIDEKEMLKGWNHSTLSEFCQIAGGWRTNLGLWLWLQFLLKSLILFLFMVLCAWLNQQIAKKHECNDLFFTTYFRFSMLWRPLAICPTNMIAKNEKEKGLGDYLMFLCRLR